MKDHLSVLVLTTEGLTSHIGGLGTYIREFRHRAPKAGGLDVRFHQIPFDARYLLHSRFDNTLSTLLREADVVHANDYFTTYAALLRRRHAKIVTVVHMLHQRFSYEGQKNCLGLTSDELKYAERAALSRSDLLVAVSDFIATELSFLGIALPPVTVVHNGAGDSFFDSQYVPRPAVTRIGICGRLIEQKGADMIPAILARLTEVPFPWTMEVVGAGPQQALLEQSVTTCKLTGQCNLRGWVPYDRMPTIYSGWHVTLSLSRYEPFGIAPLESLAAGTPVLGSVVGGMHDYCEDGHNAICARKVDADSLVGRLVTYCSRSRPLERDQVRRSVTRFRWDRTVAQMQELYCSVVASQASLRA